MPNLISEKYHTLLAGILIGSASLFIPLLRDFHWESAGLASFAATIFAGLSASGGKNSSETVFRKTTGLIIGWSLPLILFASATDCLSTDGLGYWAAGPVPSMLFGWAVGRLTLHSRLTYPVAVTVLVILVISVIPPVIEFLLFPQLYFFNHIWSYWPGPIYDELVPFDTRLLVFRGITLLWVITLWAVTGFYHQAVMRLLAFLGLAALMFSYLHISNWGLIAPEEHIQSELGSVHETSHFLIFYSAGDLDSGELNRLGENHENYLLQILEQLEISPEIYQRNPIHSYIYKDARQKKRLTGAGQTSFVPVWIRQDQTHIAFEHADRVLKHELIHIVAKQFGNWFGASTSIGLVEGLAVALDPGRYPSSADQLVAAKEEWPGAEEIQNLFSFTGFYSQAGPVSYVVSGSFVQFLLENHPVPQFRRAYRTGDIEAAYAPLSIEDLTGSWHDHLETVDVGRLDRERSEALFLTPSIFDKPCPRVENKRELGARLSHRGSAGQSAPAADCRNSGSI